MSEWHPVAMSAINVFYKAAVVKQGSPGSNGESSDIRIKGTKTESSEHETGYVALNTADRAFWTSGLCRKNVLDLKACCVHSAL